jgi:hypothetical protein
MRSVVVVSILLLACGKAEPPASGTSGAAAGSTTATTAQAGGSKFAYPPSGPGPYEGFDLAAIHKKLQGSWLVGGTAFSSIPHVWSLDGDTLTQLDSKGKRSTSTFRLLAPCYFVEGAADGGSGTYGHFVLDGETLYLGLGTAGLVQGERTIGCMLVAMYVLEKGTCTRWTKKSFSRPGTDEWEKEPGDCKYSEDGKTFSGDDTSSKRKIYGVETLNVKGKVLLTQQMEGNKAEKFPSLDAAIAKQKELIDNKTALTKTPPNLPFKAWGVESKPPGYPAGTRVWAAAVNRDGSVWELRPFRFKSFDNDAAWLTAGNDMWAPSAFVDAATSSAKAGDVVMLGAGGVGRVTGVDGDKLKVRYGQYGRLTDRTVEPTEVRAIDRGWAFGAPLAYRKGASWVTAQLVLDAGSDAFIFVDRKVMKVVKDDVRLIDLSTRYAKGGKVWAAPSSGFSLAFGEGTVLEVLGDGLVYKIKTADRQFDVSFDRVIAKL